MTRTIRIVLLTVALLAVMVSPALATGEGLWGPTTDAVDTYFGLAVILFFPILITVLTLIQSRGERNKEKRKDAMARLRRD
ncbi:MAG: hypothetical protein ACR2NA_04765 [Solirubrobacterales bacterium]